MTDGSGDGKKEFQRGVKERLNSILSEYCQNSVLYIKFTTQKT